MQAKSAGALTTWVVIFLLVCLQMTTALRPILGTSTTFFPAEKKFFLGHWGECLSQAMEPAKIASKD